MVCLQGKESDVEPKESVRVSSARSVKKSSSIAKLDSEMRDSLLCVGGRLRQAPIEQEQRHPVLLPKKHYGIDLIVRYYHLLSGNSGQEYVLFLIRKSYQIMKGRVVMRIVVSRCFSCRRTQAPSGAQKMGDLPVDRVTPNKPPFSFVGVDCFGLFWIRSQVKRYGVLFTCMSTRAMHLEVAQSMHTDSFVNSMRRFIARRGIPEVIGSLSNHDERDHDDVKYARRDWDEVAFSSKMKHKQRGCSRTTTKEFLSDSLRIWRGHRLFISVIARVLLATRSLLFWWHLEPKNPGFSFPYEANPEFDFDKNVSQSVSPDSMYRIHGYVERFTKLVLLFRMVYTNILIDYSRKLRSSSTSACC